MFALPKVKRGKEQEVVHLSDFFLESKQLESKRSCVPFIKSYVKDHLKSDNKDAKDFYFAYTFKDGVLNFLAVRSHAHIVGKLPALAKALMAPGVYCYRAGEGFHTVLHSEDGTIEHRVHSPLSTDAEDLSEIETIEGDIPKTLYLQWSMADTSRNLYPYVAMAFISALGYWAYQANSYASMSEKTRNLTAKAHSGTTKQGAKGFFPDYAQVLDDVGSKLKRADGTSVGKLFLLKDDGQNMVLELTIPNENDGRDFIKRIGGGFYSEGKVVWAVGSRKTGGASGR